jgi:hypothetical protein
LERFDWRTAAALRKKNQKRWDAVKQLTRYVEVVGREAPISAQSIQDGKLFVNPPAQPARP